MKDYLRNLELKKKFGDFGGDYSIIDLDFGRKNISAEKDKIEKILKSDQFLNQFLRILPYFLPVQDKIQQYFLINDVKVTVIPKFGREYSLAGQLALAKLMHVQKIVFGTFYRDKAVQVAKVAKTLEFEEILVVLSRELCGDTELINILKSIGVNVNSERSVTHLNQPYAFGKGFFGIATNEFYIAEDANYGEWPTPALSGLLAGLYGVDIFSKLGFIPEAVISSVRTGTDCVGLIKSVVDTEMDLISYEQTISQEYHLMKDGCYTLATRSSDTEEPNNIICPELANWWRKGNVIRLGCDRLKPISISKLNNINCSDEVKRMISIALEYKKYKSLLVMGD